MQSDLKRRLSLRLRFVFVMGFTVLLTTAQSSAEDSVPRLKSASTLDDLIRQINEIQSKAVQPDKNAAIPWLSVFGVNALGRNAPTELIITDANNVPLKVADPTSLDEAALRSLLGVASIKNFSPTLVSAEESARKRSTSAETQQRIIRSIGGQLSEGYKAPWDRFKHPDLLEFLRLNDKALDQVAKSAEKSAYYFPIIETPGPLGGAGLQDLLAPHVIYAARCLGARAMYRLATRDVEGALSDLIACRRIGSLLSTNSPDVLSYVRGASVDGLAMQGEAAVIASGLLSETQAAEYGRKLQELPPPPPIIRSFEQERYLFDPPMIAFRRELETLKDAKDDPEEVLALKKRMRQIRSRIDWEAGQKLIDDAYTDFIKVFRIADRKQQKQELARLEKQYDQWRAEEAAMMPDQLMESFEKQDGRALTTMAHTSFLKACPELMRLRSGEDRFRSRRSLAMVGYAVLAASLKDGAYPKSLNVLVPIPFKSLPVDACADRPLTYLTRPGQPPMLYSWGENGLDDAGRGYNDAPRGDDITIRFP
jgi:hypothetical protein